MRNGFRYEVLPSLCMHRSEQVFLGTQELQPLLSFRYLSVYDDIFFIWTHGKETLKEFMEKFINFTPNLRFTYKSNEKDISFLGLIVTLS